MTSVAVRSSIQAEKPVLPAEEPRSRRDHLKHVIDHAGHYLPAQGPITVFIHHNTLHAFEDFLFDEGVQRGAALFDCQPYLSEARFRKELDRGRIRIVDLQSVLHKDLGQHGNEPILTLGTRYDLRLAMLQFPIRDAQNPELHWFVAETDALTRFRSEVPATSRERYLAETRRWVMRDLRSTAGAGNSGRFVLRNLKLQESLDALFRTFGESSIEVWNEETWESFVLQALWRICRHGIGLTQPAATAAPELARHRDVVLDATGEDIDLLVNGLLIPFCAAFLDQGFSNWPLPCREQGFFQAFASLYCKSVGPPAPWLRPLPMVLERVLQAGTDPLDSVRQSLEVLGVGPAEEETFITRTLLALRGWAGMILQMELRGDRVALPAPRGSLVEYLAIRLILERLALEHVASQELGYRGPLKGLRAAAAERIRKPSSTSADQRAFLVFQVAQMRGWLPSDLYALKPEEWTVLLKEIEAFHEIERRRIFQQAYERRYRNQALDALTILNREPTHRPPHPRFQVMCCLDEREESFRRHLEEIDPDTETFGPAGFFNVAMYFRGAADAHFVPLCPIVVRPQHWVREEVLYSLDETHKRRAHWRRVLGTISHRFHLGSRTFTVGALLATGLGALATIPLLARVLLPRLAARVRRTAGSLLAPPRLTRLELQRRSPNPGPEPGHLGFTVEEMATIGERLLRDVGLTSNFARLVVLLGHGSTSANNPHKSAYDCGACGGSPGGPNGRTIAQILNDSRVRALLAEKGIAVPDDTVFVGGLHNTCKEDVTFFDLDRIPQSHHADIEEFRVKLREALERNAHERCRRFLSAPLNMSFPEARLHVEARSEDLAQTRPELGHATNALCIVARRQRTRGLFLDRRAFLTSYDPTGDDAERTILTRLLLAAIPVCAGINLEYYFSHVDPSGFGCGTKLPHNVSALLGIMDGAASDLRTGLPWQMVEIHEPVRCLFVVETTPEAMLRIMDRNETIGKLVRNGWIQLALLDPDSPEILVFRQGEFVSYEPETGELPTAHSSTDWYRGWRDHLGFARICSNDVDAV